MRVTLWITTAIHLDTQLSKSDRWILLLIFQYCDVDILKADPSSPDMIATRDWPARAGSRTRASLHRSRKARRRNASANSPEQ